MAKILAALFGGTKNDKDMKRLKPLVAKVKDEYKWASGLKDEDFPKQTEAWKEEVRNGKSLDELMPKAFALAREAAGRTLGEWHYDVQIMGAIVLHQGAILEMKTGEGKTLTSVPAAYLNALTGKGVHIVTVNDYLAQRDAAWMGQVYKFLGLTVGVVIPRQDEKRKQAAYSCDITYGTNTEFGFDYLRDNMKNSVASKAQRGHNYCIIDEIDSILIDEARTPLIISGQAEDDTPKVKAARAVVHDLKECEKDPETGDYYELSSIDKLDRGLALTFDEKGDYKLDEKSKKVTFTKQGMTHMEELLRRNGSLVVTKDEDGKSICSLYADENFELVHYVTQAVLAERMYRRDTEYLVKDGEVQIVDEFTGRVLPGRRYSEGLHQAIEAKENVRIKGQSKTFATITYQNFFRMYTKIAGMTGTADTEANEFKQIYDLDVVVVPTNVPVIRKDLPDLTYYDENMKYAAIVKDVKRIHATGQPILIGTTSIEKSEKLSRLIMREGIRHEVLNAKNHAREAYIVGEAGAKGSVTIATNMAGRGTDIKLGGSLRHMAMKKVGTEAGEDEIRKAMEELKPQYQKAYEEVKALGGLCIIGSERHESRRIDNQLRGRAGRQGDPGSSQFYVALDDPLMRLFAKEGLREMVGNLGMKDGEPIHHKMLDNAIENAQKRVEERHFEIRKHLLEYDNVLNEQRNFIYHERDTILTDPDLADRVLASAEELIDSAWEDAGGSQEAFAENYMQLFSMQPAGNAEDCKKAYAGNLRAKEALVGKEGFNSFIRFVYLRNIDKRWIDHLDALEDLRDAARLMSYAQKNPLVEYKNTASDAFSELIENISKAVCKTVNAVNITLNTTKKTPQDPGRKLEAVHNPLQPVNKNTAVTKESQAHSTTVVRSTPKVGRNDPCPCGSGKKYKNCCGKKY